MASPKQNSAAVAAALPQWVAATVEHNESFRFEALTLLEQAKSRLAELQAKPPADPSSVAVAALHPLHLTVKALLAAKAYKCFSTRATLELLRTLYATELPADLVKAYVDVQALRVQGTKSLDVAKSLLDAASSLLTRAS